MDLHVHGLPAPPLHRLPRLGNWQSTCNESNRTDRAIFHCSTSPVPETDASHEHPLLLLSKIDPLPQRQTIQRISRGLDRRYAAVRLQAFDWVLRVAPGRKQQEEGLGSIRDEIRKILALAEKGELPNGAIDDQEKQRQQERRREGPGLADTENDKLLRAAIAAEDVCGWRPDCSEAQKSSRQRKRRQTRLSSPTDTDVTPRSIRLHILRTATSDSYTSSRTSAMQNDKCTQDRVAGAIATSQPSWGHHVACLCSHPATTVGGQQARPCVH